MKKYLLILILAFIHFNPTFAHDEFDDQLHQLAADIPYYIVGTPDETFEACYYNDGKLCFIINPDSKTGKIRLEDPYNENLYPALLKKIFSGDLQQSLNIMDFMIQTDTLFCLKIKMPGTSSYSEHTILPYIIKHLLTQ